MELKMIAVDEIQPNPFQPRESFEKESLRELADSIRDASVIQPIVVRRHGKGYQIIAGERRWRAAQMAGLKEVPSLIKDIPEGRVLLESLIENLHRKDLTDIEMENAIHQLWENNEALGFKTIMELAKKLGVHSDFVSRHLDAWEIRHEEHVDKRVSTDAIRVTRGLEVEERKKLLEKVAEGDLGVRETYTAVKVLRKASQPL
ncbi:MAG: ParB/RepB/Spo0J family partition protein, partial [Candidatus Bathyarchaeota archaeon]|nr:ParB/RepB/Spo0J family partition protein [Candidatus Bathyarchaeota archaeon]